MDTTKRAGSAPATGRQREALSSPLRLELFGHFVDGRALSVRELGERMGRSASSIYYHVHLLVEVGLLRESGRGPRGEALYEAVRSRVELSPVEGAGDAILRTMSAAFRMAERDLEAALPGAARSERSSRVFATRLHFRAGPEMLEEVRSHLRAALEVIEREVQREEVGPEDGPLHSLTLALLPLRGRTHREETE